MKRDKTPYREAAIRLKARRTAKGISVPVLAGRIGVSTARYRSWENLFGPLPQRQYGAAIDRILDDEAALPPCPDDDSSSPPQELDYRELGARARVRRERLGMSRAFVAGKIGINGLKLSQWESSLPRQHRREIEDAWEDAIKVPRGWIRSPLTDLLPLHTRMPSLSEVGCLTVEDEIRAVGAWLSRAMEGSRIWLYNDLSEDEKKRAAMFAERYGVSADGDTTLQAIGSRFSITRERVRQVVDVMTGRARGIQFDLPRLNQIKEAASTHRFWRVSDFNEAHRDILGCVQLPDADRFAREILGFGIASFSDRAFTQNANPICPVIIDDSFHDLMISVRAAAIKMHRSCGAAHVMYVTGLASEILGKPVSHADVLRALPAIEGMEWLTEDEDWFWLGPDFSGNRALEAVRKVLAVASRRVDVEDLHQAVCRSRRACYKSDARAHPPEIEMPQEVLRELLSRVHWLTVVQMNDFVLAEDVAIEDVLNSSELAVVRLIGEHGGAAARNIFNKRLVEAGLFTQANLQFVLAGSPVIKQLGFGVYGIRGVELPQKAFSEAVACVPNRPLLSVDV